MKSPLAIWSVVVDRVGGVDRDISTVAKNAYQWCVCCRTFGWQMRNMTLYTTCVLMIMVRVTSASSQWSWMPFAVVWYWLCTCDAACTVCSPDQSISGGRRVIFNSGNDVDHSMLTQVVYMLSLSVILIALVDMLAFSSVSTVALSFEQSGGGSTVRAELASPNLYPGQLMRFEMCLCMETVLKVWVSSSADMWLHHDLVGYLP